MEAPKQSPNPPGCLPLLQKTRTLEKRLINLSALTHLSYVFLIPNDWALRTTGACPKSFSQSGYRSNPPYWEWISVCPHHHWSDTLTAQCRHYKAAPALEKQNRSNSEVPVSTSTPFCLGPLRDTQPSSLILSPSSLTGLRFLRKISLWISFFKKRAVILEFDRSNQNSNQVILQHLLLALSLTVLELILRTLTICPYWISYHPPYG